MVREWRATLRRGVVGAFGPLVRKLAALEDILWALWEHPAVVGVGLDLRNIRWDGGRRTWQVRHTCEGSERLVGSFAVARFGGCREAAQAAVEARDRHLLACAGAVAPGGLCGVLAQ
jgi:hypothetical protein